MTIRLPASPAQSLLRKMIAAGLRAADPYHALLGIVSLEGQSLRVGRRAYDLTRYNRVIQTAYQEIADHDSEQRSEIERLERVAAGSVWAERIAGALILCTGMVLGAIWHRIATRNRGTRLRL